MMRLPSIIGLLLLGLGSAGNIRAAPDAIHQQSFVTIGGIEQWITIKGTSSDNPVVLFLHGGPGNAMSAYADSLYGGWEKDFTLVQWDQRGAGKTYGRSGPSIASTLSLERMTKDGIEVAAYLTRHLHKKRIVLVGNSWGSLLGVSIARQRPDLFYAYVGTAQLVDMRTNLTASYQRVVERAREFGDFTAVGELNGIGAPPWKSVARWQIFRNFVGSSMTGPLMDVNLKKPGAEFKIPVYVIQGGADLNAVPEIAREYVQWIKAPAKEFIVVPKSGHAHTQASLDALFKVLTHQVRADIARAGS